MPSSAAVAAVAAVAAAWTLQSAFLLRTAAAAHSFDAPVHERGDPWPLPPPASMPLLLYYGTFGPRDDSLNSQLVVGGNAETMFCTSYGDTTYSVGGTPTCTNVNASILDLDLAKSVLGQTPYLTVDELRPDKHCKQDCTEIVTGLKEAGLGGRIIFYFRYTSNNPNWPEWAKLIALCAQPGMCRKIVFETCESCQLQ